MLPKRVQMTAIEAAAVRQSFVRRQLGLLVLSALMLAEFFVAISISQWTVLTTVVFVVLGVACAVASILVWRCPRCGESFGRNWLVTQCPNCFAELTERGQPPRPSA
jgi:H+/Cl- antiporter ClcA